MRTVTDRAAAWTALTRGETRGPPAAVLRAGLWWARWPYGLGVWSRNRAFDVGWKRVARATVPVVSVGNLTLGGTGKTPCVEYVARAYRDFGKQVAILSRGYGADSGPNDEALVLEANLPDVPHLQGRDRAALAATAVDELESEILVLDDGFQHRRLHRDLDVVLLDATRPISREYLFPRGSMREPVSGLKRAGLAIFTRCDQAGEAAVAEQRTWLGKRFPNLPTATATHAPVELIGTDDRTEPVAALQGRPLGIVSGIGNPAAFRRTLADLRASAVGERTFPDHHNYTRSDVDALRTWAETLPADAWIATTQKDWVKLQIPDLAGRPLWAVRVGMQFLDGEDTVREKLLALTPE